MYRLKIEYDQDAQNPRREYDNADIMYCEHRRYNLGDKDADNPYTEVSFVELRYQRADGTSAAYVLEDDDTEGEGLRYTDVLAMLKEHAEEAADDASAPPEPDEAPDAQQVYDATLERAQAGYDYVRNANWDSEHRLNPGIALIRPLFLYDHGGITISAGAFSCPWDSGQVGWQYITDDVLADEWNGDEAKALKYMDATLETYDDYLTGNVHGYTVEKGTRYAEVRTYADGTSVPMGERIEWEHEDSCWGFIGDWWKEGDPTGMGDNFDGELKALFDSLSYSDVGEWHYTASVPEELRDER